MNEKKYALLKVSDGKRGEMGKQKIYEIVVSGNKVTTSWGMAEKAQRQSSVQVYATEGAASQAAKVKLWDKLAGGYRLAYSV